MKRVRNRGVELSQLIPKNHFCSMSFFREEPLINWSFTNSVLLTAYDVYRSNDFWIDSVIRSGRTLKEAMVDLGFPKRNTMVADTGIFELEARKAGIARDLGINVNLSLSNSQVFEAYEMSGADIFVAPDEIILATDDKARVGKKVGAMEVSLLDLLEITDPERIIAVIQGQNEDVMRDLFDFYRSHGVTHFALGGLIPLWKYDRTLFRWVLNKGREITQGFWLHTFGLPIISLLPFYLHEIGMNSVDTSALLYMTARRQYLVGFHPRPVRRANFSICDCQGCSALTPEINPRSHDFFIRLYIHNLTEATRSLLGKSVISLDETDVELQLQNGISEKITIMHQDEIKKPDEEVLGWRTASEGMDSGVQE